MNTTDRTKLTRRWQTICTVGYQGSVGRFENRAAHGSVCHCQARLVSDGTMQGRRVNANGLHEEIGDAFYLDSGRLEIWESIARSQR
jgi:hypothetical protein